jgi:hypothetical protein
MEIEGIDCHNRRECPVLIKKMIRNIGLCKGLSSIPSIYPLPPKKKEKGNVDFIL